MRIFEELNRDNFLLYAAKYYNNPGCTNVEEFKEDLNRFKYIKRLFNRYEQNGDLQERLILNHFIVIYNVFGIAAANKMVWYKFHMKHWPYVKPFLVFLHYLPENEKVEVPLDSKIVERLRNL